MRTFNILIILLLLSLSPQVASAYVVDSVLAQVGDKIITQYDLEAYAPAQVRAINALSDNEREVAWNQYYNSTITNLIRAHTVEIACARAGVLTSQEEVDAAVIALQEQNSMFRDELMNIVAREGQVTPEIRLYVQTIILQEKLMPMLRYRSVVTDEDIIKYMREDMNIVHEAEEYHVKLLFLPDKELYEAVKDKIASDFDKIVAETGTSTIDMGFIQSNVLRPEMGALLKGMKAKEVSAPYVDAEGRYVVLWVPATRKSSGLSEADRNYMMNTLKYRQMEVIFNNWLERNEKTIIVHRYDK